TSFSRDWSSDVCSSDLNILNAQGLDVARSTTTKIADLLNRFPAENTAAFNQSMKQMADFETEELEQMILMLSPGASNDQLEYARSEERRVGKDGDARGG